MSKFERKIDDMVDQARVASDIQELYQASRDIYYALNYKVDMIIKEVKLDRWDEERLKKFFKLMERLIEFNDSE